MASPIELSKISWKEFSELVKSGVRTVILPTGSTEQHGYHLPLGTDTISAQAVAIVVSERVGAILAPAIPYGMSSTHMKFPGTCSLQYDTMTRVVYDVCASLAKNGIERIAIINGHGLNGASLEIASRNVKQEFGTLITVSDYWYALVNEYKKLINQDVSFRHFWAHGGIMESSIVMNQYPESVHLERATVSGSEKVEMFEDPSVSYFENSDELGSSGSHGDPTLSTLEIGGLLIERAGINLAEKLKVLWRELENARRKSDEKEQS
jgi:creatinine amidohydrolase/Fe(II)-dependent formamide hydrolase-like protein